MLSNYYLFGKRSIEERDIEIDIDRGTIEEYYLFNLREEGELHYKLLLTKHDKETLIHLLKDRDLPADKSHRMEENYRFFEAKLKSTDLQAVYKGIQKLMIVDISLNRDYDNPQLIFESLNSTGLDLSQADLIRNYVLMGQEPNFQNRLYETYWYPMEQRFGEEYTKRFDRFMRDYLTLKTRQIPKIDNVYESFKEYVDNKKQPEVLEATVAEIDRYSKHYVRIALLKEEDSEIRSLFDEINALSVEVVFPFLLEVYEDYTQGKIEKADVIETLRLIVSYIFRRTLCGIPTNGLNRTFAGLMLEVDKSNYLENLKFAFSQRPFSQRYPSNEEFGRSFLIRDIYRFRSKKFRPRDYLLRKLENYGRKEPISVGDYTIEHVMPQTLSEEWQAELGEDWSETHETYLHTIGNLTLTGYNPELSNRSFREKQEMPGGFRNSPLRLNRSLAQAERWNKIAIEDRAEMLAEKAREIWPYHGVSQEIRPEHTGDWTLADHHHLAGEMKALFEQLRGQILNLDAPVTEQINKQTIAYRIDTIFADIVPQAKRLRLSLKLPFSDINDPQRLCKDVADVGRWGVGDVEVGISSVDQLNYIMSLIRQAFERQI